MASHEELVAELPKLEKMSNAARLKLARKRRLKQLKKNQELTRREKETGQYVPRAKLPNKINFISQALLHEAVCRNDCSEGKIRPALFLNNFLGLFTCKNHVTFVYWRCTPLLAAFCGNLKAA